MGLKKKFLTPMLHRPRAICSVLNKFSFAALKTVSVIGWPIDAAPLAISVSTVILPLQSVWNRNSFKLPCSVRPTTLVYIVLWPLRTRVAITIDEVLADQFIMSLSALPVFNLAELGAEVQHVFSDRFFIHFHTS